MEHQPTKREMHSHKRNIKRRHHNPLFQRGALTLQAPMFKESKRGSQRGYRKRVFTLRQQLKWVILAFKCYSDWAALTCHCTNVQKEKRYLQRELHLYPGELIWEANAVIRANPPAVFYKRDTGAIHQRAPKRDEEQAPRKTLMTEKEKRCTSSAVTMRTPLTHSLEKGRILLHTWWGVSVCVCPCTVHF